MALVMIILSVVTSIVSTKCGFGVDTWQWWFFVIGINVAHILGVERN